MEQEIYNVFENNVVKIFVEAGYEVERQVQINKKHSTYDYKRNVNLIDIVAIKSSVTYCVEVRLFKRMEERILHRLYAISNDNNMIPIYVTAYCINESERELIHKDYPNMIVIDLANLLYAVQDNIELRKELISGLSFSVDDITPKEGFLKLNSLQHDNHLQNLIEEIQNCKSGRKEFRKYEVICREMLENIFYEDLTLWKEQKSSNDNLFRFDLLCRIKDENQKTFWSIIEKYFNSKYIIFEFKNYSKPISQTEIYTTEKYLYSKALRSVGFIVSANGYDKNAQWAAKGCLRENGKLIILLDTEDMIKMSKIVIDNEDPSEYLLNKLDEILLTLEK